MNNNNISIALCTHNGAKYLPLQLKSIVSQRVQPYEIVICDDLSSDNTVSMIQEFASSAKIPTRIYYNAERIGVIANFSKAISLCRGEYVALCDQDDIWLSEKLELTLKKMKEAEGKYGSEIPLLVHTDLTVINSEDEPIASSFMRMQKLQPRHADILKMLPVQNIVTGCTVLINRRLADLAIPISGNAVIHDWWLALLASTSGKMIYEPKPTVLYRKHSDNFIGAKGYFSYDNLSKVFNLRQADKDLAAAIRQAAAVRRRLKGYTQEDNLYFLNKFISCLQSGGIRSVQSAYKLGIRKSSLVLTLYLFVLLLKGSYRDMISS